LPQLECSIYSASCSGRFWIFDFNPSFRRSRAITAFCEVGHGPVRLCHVKRFRTQPQHGVIHEKENLECDCRSLDCSSCHPRCDERGYCPTDPTVSTWGLPYHAASEVGVAALRQNGRTAAPE